MEIQIKERLYDCRDDNLVVSKYNMLGKKQMVWDCRINLIEILRYDPKFPKLIFVIPEYPMMPSKIILEPGKDWAENLSKLYNYFVEHGATERHLSSFEASFAKHSSYAMDKRTAKANNTKTAQSTTRANVNRTPVSHFGCKMKKEEKYICQRCNAVWYSGTYDAVKNLANASHGSLWSLNQVKDFSQCPQCGSRASRHKTVKVWYDKKGNAVDFEE